MGHGGGQQAGGGLLHFAGGQIQRGGIARVQHAGRAGPLAVKGQRERAAQGGLPAQFVDGGRAGIGRRNGRQQRLRRGPFAGAPEITGCKAVRCM